MNEQARKTPASLTTLLSGGQTGVDRAALDASLALGLRCAGWCPRHRRAEDGPIPDRYPLRETASAGYAERTRRNVLAADATLIVSRGRPTGGTRLTLRLARQAGCPCLVVDLSLRQPHWAEVAAWIRDHGFAVVNVAGPRESKAPGIYQEALNLLRCALSCLSRF